MAKLEGCLFSVGKAAKNDMKRPSHATDAEGSGKVYNYMYYNIGDPGIRENKTTKLWKSSILESLVRE